MQKSYLVIGTDTDVGKTYVGGALIQQFANAGSKTAGMKPVASGCELGQQGIWHGELVNGDVLALSNAANVRAELDLINPYRFAPAIAPHIAAAQAGVDISLEVVANAYHALAEMADVLIVEGAGGFLVPLNARQSFADLAVKLDIPIILVVGMRLGCINHALLTVEAIKSRGLTLAGWVANQIDPDMPMFAENLGSLQQHITAPCLGVVPWQGSTVFNLLE